MSPQSPHLFSVIQEANQRYRRIAQEIRQSLQPTFHARRRAICLGLVVDIQKAGNCPQRQISVHPLPIIDTTPSPNETLTIRIPAKPRSSAQNPRQNSQPTSRLLRPNLKCTIPTISQCKEAIVPSQAVIIHAPSVLRGRNVPWRGPTSRWSVDLDDTTGLSPRRTSPDVPMDTVESPLEGLELQYPTTAELQTNSGSSCDSSSSRSSSMLMTPDEVCEAPVMSRTGKRKAEDGHLVSTTSLAKHPKFARKEWIHTNDMHL